MTVDEDFDDQGNTLLVPPILGAPLVSRNGHPHWPAADGYIHAQPSQVESLRVQGCRRLADVQAEVAAAGQPVPEQMVYAEAVIDVRMSAAAKAVLDRMTEGQDDGDDAPVKQSRRRAKKQADEPDAEPAD